MKRPTEWQSPHSSDETVQHNAVERRGTGRWIRKEITMKSKSKERLPERVPFAAIPTGEKRTLFAQAGLEYLGIEPRDIALWAHRLAWTDRMLETLEQSSERR